MNEFFSSGPEIVEAVESDAAVVALESTIFTHGLPRPESIAVALEAERIVRQAGAVPATIGVHHGVPTIGLNAEQIEELAYDDDVLKCGIRELPFGAVHQRNAGTTIAATCFLAHAAQVKVFATGGLGGVHHGAAQSFDESADLVALAKNPVVLVSSGAKAVLDVGATLERLETLSVPILGYRTNRYPGFYVPDSGFGLEHRVESPQQIAQVYAAQRQLGMTSALLIGNPIPLAEQLDPQLLEEAVIRAWAALSEAGISGQAVTPFLLDFIRQHTAGQSLHANIALYYNNVRLAAKIALAMTSGRGQ